MKKAKEYTPKFVVCINNDNYLLTPGKKYPILDGEEVP